MNDYIMDMRDILSRYNDSNTEILIEQKTKIYQYEDEHHPNVYLKDLKVGDRLYAYDCEDGYLLTEHYFVEIEITHIYNDVFFYKIVNPPTGNPKWLKERHFVENCIFALQNIWPKKIVIDKHYMFNCKCPYTEFILDDNMENKYSSIYYLENI